MAKQSKEQKTKWFSFVLEPSLFMKGYSLAQRMDMSFSKMLRLALREFIERMEKQFQ